MKSLVAYFSAQGATAKVARELAAAIDADLFEIRPETPYSAADLRWTNPLARCNREKFGKKDVPVAGRIDGFADYDTVWIGFPVWWYTAEKLSPYVRGGRITAAKLVHSAAELI